MFPSRVAGGQTFSYTSVSSLLLLLGLPEKQSQRTPRCRRKWYWSGLNRAGFSNTVRRKHLRPGGTTCKLAPGRDIVPRLRDDVCRCYSFCYRHQPVSAGLEYSISSNVAPSSSIKATRMKPFPTMVGWSMSSNKYPRPQDRAETIEAQDSACRSTGTTNKIEKNNTLDPMQF
jgi:hypothetical protein